MTVWILVFLVVSPGVETWPNAVGPFTYAECKEWRDKLPKNRFANCYRVDKAMLRMP